MEILRPAGLNERRCIARDVLGLYGSIVTCATYIATSGDCQDLPRDDIIRALKQCVVEQPALSTVVLDAETEKPQLARCACLDLTKHLRIMVLESEHGESKLLEKLLEQVHNDPFDALHTRPPWRVYIQHLPPTSPSGLWRFRVAFAHSHILMDGMSSLLFHKTFVRAAGEAASLPLDSLKPLAPPLENAGHFTISWSFLLRPLVNEFLPVRLVRAIGMSAEVPLELWTGTRKRPERPAPGKLLRTAVKVLTVPQETLKRVLTACRAHKARLTGLLVVMVAKALAHTLQDRNQDFTTFEACTAIDLCRCLSSDHIGMANYVSAVTDRVNLSHGKSFADCRNALTGEDWATAQRISEHHRQASSSLADQPIALLKYLGNFREWTTRNAEKPADASFDMSNLGVFDGGPLLTSTMASRQQWRMNEMVFSQSANATGAPLNINVASLKDGPLAINVTWWPGMLGLENEIGFVDDLLSHIWHQLRALA